MYLYLLTVFFFDIKYQIIPNKLTVGTLIVGWIFALMQGFQFFLLSLAGSMIGFILLLIPFLFGWVGGGDVKFLVAAGGLFDIVTLLHILLYGLIIGGILAFAFLFFRGGWKSVYRALIAPNQSQKNKEKVFIPLGSCMSIAGLIILLLKAGVFQ